MSLIASGKITSPVSDILVALPSGHELFKLTLSDLLADGGAMLAYRLTADGGSTYYDQANQYRDVWQVNNGSNIQANTTFSEGQPGDMGFLGQRVSTSFDGAGGPTAAYTPSMLEALIDPGSPLRRPSVSVPMSFHRPGQSPEFGSGVSNLIVEVPSRVNGILIGPYFGDGRVLTRGFWWLEGFATP